jgi:hypothetical protein
MLKLCFDAAKSLFNGVPRGMCNDRYGMVCKKMDDLKCDIHEMRGWLWGLKFPDQPLPPPSSERNNKDSTSITEN